MVLGAGVDGDGRCTAVNVTVLSFWWRTAEAGHSGTVSAVTPKARASDVNCVLCTMLWTTDSDSDMGAS